MKVLISAAETSSDAHGAALLRALKELDPAVDAFGVGGPKLQAEGLRTVVDSRELLAMGFSEVFGRLPRILRAIREIHEAAIRERPDVAVVIDYPDFHFRLARRLNALRVPVIYYIPPKVWVWRKKRIRILRERFVKVLSILPFETEFYQNERMPVKYVGNPLVDQLPMRMSRNEARASLGLSQNDEVVVLLPGSRPAELARHIDPMLAAVKLAAGRLGRELKVLLPLPVTVDSLAFQAIEKKFSGSGIRARVSRGDSAVCMLAADAGLIKSGTSTLEAGVLGLPHAVVYRPSWLTGWLFRNVVRYRGPVGLVNLVAGYSSGKPYLAREILCEEVTAENLANELISLLEPARREEMKRGLEALRNRLTGDASSGSPSVLAAREVIATFRERA